MLRPFCSHRASFVAIMRAAWALQQFAMRDAKPPDCRQYAWRSDLSPLPDAYASQSLWAVTLSSGDIVITADLGPTASGEDYGLMRIDPVTDHLDNTHGSGPLFSNFAGGLTILPDGRLLVPSQTGFSTLIRRQGIGRCFLRPGHCRGRIGQPYFRWASPRLPLPR